MLRQTKHLIPAAIILFWAVMMGALIYREVIIPAQYPRLTAQRISEPQDIWMGLSFGEQPVGFIHWSTKPEDRDSDEGFGINVLARMAMPMGGEQSTFFASGEAWMSAVNGLRDFNFSLKSGDYDMRLEGVVRDGSLDGKIHAAGEIIPLKLPVAKELLLGGGMGLGAFAMPVVEPGQTVFVDTFDPSTMSVGRAKVAALEKTTLQIAGKPVETTLLATTIGGMTTRAWVDAKQEVVRAETQFGFIMQKITPAEALTQAANHPAADASLGGVFIKPKGPEPSRNARRVRMRITGVPGDRLPPDTPVQQRDGDVYTITTPDPGDATIKDDITSAEITRFLGSDAFITSDHERIRAVVREAAEGVTDDCEKVRRLNGWVFGHLEKVLTMSMPNALEVLRTRKGDCNEHSVLLAALLRAADIPARVVLGVAWSDKMHVFGYHAWVEAYVGRWLPVDPTFGQDAVDATHLKLVDGGIEDWPRLMGYLGAIQIEILETSPANPDATETANP